MNSPFEPLLNAIRYAMARLTPDEAHRLLSELEGKRLILALNIVNQPPFYFGLAVDKATLQPCLLDNKTMARHDVLIEGTPGGLFQLMVYQSMDQVTVKGSLQTARQFQQALSHLAIDWEDSLARLIGDYPTRQVSRSLGSFQRFSRVLGETLLLNLSEYLRYESRQLPLKPEIEQFIHQVDELHDQSERLQARLRQLQRKIAP